jgi:hypothetical protein
MLIDIRVKPAEGVSDILPISITIYEVAGGGVVWCCAASHTLVVM